MDKFHYTVAINPNLDLPGFLDMLRYDRAIIRNWNRVDDGTRMVYTIEFSTDRDITIDRWASFGLYPKKGM